MRKFASKFLLDVLLSVVATVCTAYVTHHYFPGAAPAKTPVTAEATSVEREVAPEQIAASKASSDVIATVAAAAAAVDDRGTDTNSDEKAGPPSPPGKSFKPALPAAHRPAPRDNSTLKNNAVVTPRPVQMATVVPVPSNAAPERRGLSPIAPLAPDAPQPGDDRSERDVIAPPPPETSKRHLAGLVWRPIMRTFAVVAGAFTSHERRRSDEY